MFLQPSSLCPPFSSCWSSSWELELEGVSIEGEQLGERGYTEQENEPEEDDREGSGVATADIADLN